MGVVSDSSLFRALTSRPSKKTDSLIAKLGTTVVLLIIVPSRICKAQRVESIADCSGKVNLEVLAILISAFRKGSLANLPLGKIKLA